MFLILFTDNGVPIIIKSEPSISQLQETNFLHLSVVEDFPN